MGTLVVRFTLRLVRVSGCCKSVRILKGQLRVRVVSVGTGFKILVSNKTGKKKKTLLIFYLVTKNIDL